MTRLREEIRKQAERQAELRQRKVAHRRWTA